MRRRTFKYSLFSTAVALLVTAVSCTKEEPDAVQVDGITLSETALTLAVGGSETLTATITPDNAADKTLTWTSSAPEVATVENGVITALSVGTATVTATSANGKTATCEVIVRNDYLVLTEAFNTVGKEFLQVVFLSQGYGQYAPFMQSNVRLLRVVYATEYPKGEKINASGALLVSENFDPRFPVTVLTHGTNSDRNIAPSTEIQKPIPSSMDVFLGMAIASAFNCALLMPDYIGYGESQSVTHPYMHGESLGQAGLDLIRAFREYAASPSAGLSFNSNLFITGYSEGGYAAVALHKAVDEHPADGLKVIKNVAGAGAYDMEAFSKEVLSNPQELGVQMRSSYLWTINMYKKDFGYSKAYANIFSEKDNSLLQSIDYDMAYDKTAKLPLSDVAGELFHPEFISGILGGTDTEFIRISRENSFTDFVPKDSLIFVWGDADNRVYPVNSENAYNAMHNKGCKVAAYVQPGGDHTTTMPLYVNIVIGRLQATEREIE